jgi:hypothetical protein
MSYLYQRQRLLVPQIEKFAKIKVEEAYREMKPGSRVAGDGAWGHAKRAIQAQDALVCLDTNKVVATEIVEIRRKTPKARAGRRAPPQLGDFNGSPQASEGEGYRRIGKREMERPKRGPGRGRIGLVVTDRQNGVTNIIRELGLPWRHTCDGNHVMKSVEARFTEFKSYRVAGRKTSKHVLPPIHAGLMSWFYASAKLAGTLAEKQKMWVGAIEHYTRAKSRWTFKGDEAAVACLRGFVMAAAPELARYQREESTNPVESLNALRAKKAGKDYAWKNSWRGRAHVAVLEFNEGPRWIVEFCEWAGIVLPEAYISMVQSANDDLFRERKRRGEREYRKAEMKTRVDHKAFLAGLAQKHRKEEVVHEAPGKGTAGVIILERAAAPEPSRRSRRAISLRDGSPQADVAPVAAESGSRVGRGPRGSAVVTPIAGHIRFADVGWTAAGIANETGAECHFLTLVEILLLLPVSRALIAEGGGELLGLLRELMIRSSSRGRAKRLRRRG